MIKQTTFFEGYYSDIRIDASSVCYYGIYKVVDLSTRFLVSFTPFGWKDSLVKDFCIRKNRKIDFSYVINFITENWIR